jgi:lysosomal acid lipase/cholesteryl ester hydrolase
MFYALSHNEDYFANKVSLFIALGPVTQMNDASSDLIYFIAKNDAWIIETCEIFGIYDMFPANWITTGAMRLICGVIPELCNFGAYLICDEDASLDTQDRLDDYMGHFPSGTSLKCLDHYGQIMTAGKFQRYDYGSDANIRIYGSPTPPAIALNNIKGKVPIAMFVGTHDGLADPYDNQWAHGQMGSAVIFYHEYTLSHLSFMVARDMSFWTVDAMYLIG